MSYWTNDPIHAWEEEKFETNYASCLNELAELPDGSLIAVDSEAVLVAHAESILTDVGSRLTRADGRYALARLSLFDCHSRSIFMDDYVMPKEKVVDYLTRFSGIHPEDLDCNSSRHHLVTMRVAYLKLRALVQR